MVESWHLVFGVAKGAGSVPPTGTGICCMTWHLLSGIWRWACILQCCLLSEENLCAFFKSNPLGVCLFPMNILALSSALWKFPCPLLSFPFPLFSLYLPYALPLLFPPFSFIPSWWEKSRISLFRSDPFGPCLPHSSAWYSPPCMFQRRICAYAQL